MAGSRSMWMGGEWQAWAGGSRSMWMGGLYGPIIQNSQPLQQIKLESAHKLAPNLGAGVKVAVIDTGIDLAHPAFNGALAPSGEWKDFYGNDNLPQEEGTLGVGGYGHGTAVASIVLQVAPKATILPLRVLGPNGEGDTLQVANAIRYAVTKGARVINLSLGSTTRSDTVQTAVKTATDAGVLVVSSAGNDNTPVITYPAMTANDKGILGERSLSVGSVNSLDLKSSFSNYAPDLELSAPGENIYAAGPGACWSRGAARRWRRRWRRVGWRSPSGRRSRWTSGTSRGRWPRTASICTRAGSTRLTRTGWASGASTSTCS